MRDQGAPAERFPKGFPATPPAWQGHSVDTQMAFGHQYKIRLGSFKLSYIQEEAIKVRASTEKGTLVFPSRRTAISMTRPLRAPCTIPTTRAAVCEEPTSTSTSRYFGPLQWQQRKSLHLTMHSKGSHWAVRPWHARRECKHYHLTCLAFRYHDCCHDRLRSSSPEVLCCQLLAKKHGCILAHSLLDNPAALLDSGDDLEHIMPPRNDFPIGAGLVEESRHGYIERCGSFRRRHGRRQHVLHQRALRYVWARITRPRHVNRRHCRCTAPAAPMIVISTLFDNLECLSEFKDFAQADVAPVAFPVFLLFH